MQIRRQLSKHGYKKQAQDEWMRFYSRTDPKKAEWYWNTVILAKQ